MYNPHKTRNLKTVKKLIEKERYTDLGWANEGVEFSNSMEKRKEPIQSIDCSLYASRGTHYVYVDHEHKEILHVDMSD